MVLQSVRGSKRRAWGDGMRARERGIVNGRVRAARAASRDANSADLTALVAPRRGAARARHTGGTLRGCEQCAPSRRDGLDANACGGDEQLIAEVSIDASSCAVKREQLVGGFAGHSLGRPTPLAYRGASRG